MRPCTHLDSQPEFQLALGLSELCPVGCAPDQCRATVLPLKALEDGLRLLKDVCVYKTLHATHTKVVTNSSGGSANGWRQAAWLLLCSETLLCWSQEA